jgi:hypothetical protein
VTDNATAESFIPPMASSQSYLLFGMALLGALAACAPTAPPPVSAAARQCLAELDRRGIQYQPEAMPASVSPCTVENPVRVTAAGVPWNQPGIVSCGFALELARFTREVVEPAALRYFGEPVRRLRHFGTYSCRDMRDGRLSEHAHGKAIDIAGFELHDGTLVLVARDWRRGGPRGRFLRDIARRACRYFSVVLTPDSNRDHHDHIHLDAGPYRLCWHRTGKR